MSSAETPEAARLELPPSGTALAYALLLHDSPNAQGIAEALVAAGFGVLTHRFGALGSLDELLGLARRLEAERGAPGLLVGHGVGALAALLAAPRLPSVRAVATLAAPAKAEGQDSSLQARLAEVLGEKGRAFLFLHAPGDEVVPVGHAARLYELARHPKSFVSLDGADHALSQWADARYAGRLIAAWAERYLDLDEARALAYREARASVARTEAGLQTRVSVRGFELVADEPVKVGGRETGPTPVDFVAVALSSCAAMTLRMYADRKGWPLEAATVSVRQRKPAEGEAQARFERSVVLEGELSDAQRARLLEIAERCPVHRMLAAAEVA